MSPVGTVIGVFRGGCAVVHEDRVRELRLLGRHAEAELTLAVGDRVEFDPEKEVVLERQPRTTALTRLRPQAGRRQHRPGAEQAIAANVDRLAIVMSVAEPPFRSGAVDRLWLAAVRGGLEAILVVNKIDLLAGQGLPEVIDAYRGVLPVFLTSATEGHGIQALREALADSSTVLAGHSGVGKSSLINALEPEVRLETGAVREKSRKGRHTTTSATWLRLPGNAIVVDTPGVREIAVGPVDTALLDDVYPDIAAIATDCRFRNCRHHQEPNCAVRTAIETAQLHPGRLTSYHKLHAEASTRTH